MQAKVTIQSNGSLIYMQILTFSKGQHFIVICIFIVILPDTHEKDKKQKYPKRGRKKF